MPSFIIFCSGSNRACHGRENLHEYANVFRLTFSVNQDDFAFILKLRGCQACQPSLFFAADLMALAMGVRICANTLTFVRLAFSVTRMIFDLF